MADLNELLAGAMNQEPVLGKSEIKAIGLAVISNNLAIAARRGRPLFMSNVARDVNSLNGIAAGGLDLNSLLMMQMMGGGEAKKPDGIEATLNKVLERLDDLENAATRGVSKGK
tara:strand:- start:105 stop:446 length:342 start_codon:yes stop_codon:yes gene_type:complete